jgi:hypothetical protein
MGVSMMMVDYLRAQAATCLQWSRDCFDLATATRLRLLAEELAAKADELEAGAPARGTVCSHVRPLSSHRAGPLTTRGNAS